jgi:hypothetical protein
MNTNKYAIIVKHDNEFKCITIEASELLHIAYIARGLTNHKSSVLEAIAIEQDGVWEEVK